MIKHVFHAAALGGLVFLTGCGGGGGGSSDSGTPSGIAIPKTVVGAKVAGPLDTVQTQLTDGVFDPLQSAVDGTVLGAVVQCTDQLVNQDVIDIADTLLVALQQQAANPAGADPQALAGSLRALVVDLSQLLGSMAGEKVDCAVDILDVDRLQNLIAALEGTPLAPLAPLLQPVVTQIIEVVGADGTSPASLAQIRDLIANLSTALQQGIAQLPEGALDSPIVGGALTTLATAIGDTQALLDAALRRDNAATSAALQALVEHTLSNLLTRVVPLQAIEENGGQPGLLSDRIKDAVENLTTVIGNTTGHVIDPTFDALLSGALGPVLQPVIDTVLPAVLGPITDALDQLTGGEGNTGPLAGTVLAPVVNLVETVLGDLLGHVSSGGGTGGTGGDTGGGSGSQCVFANRPLLAPLCLRR